MTCSNDSLPALFNEANARALSLGSKFVNLVGGDKAEINKDIDEIIVFFCHFKRSTWGR